MGRIDESDDRIARAASAYVDDFYAFHPHRATWDGWHARDGQAPDISRAAIAGRVRELEAWGGRLAALRATLDAGRTGATLSPESARADLPELEALECARQDELFRLGRWRRHESDPRAYYPALDVSVYVARDFAPPRERLAALTRYLRGVPDVLRGAHEGLADALARPTLACAVAAYRRLAAYYAADLGRAGRALAATERERRDFRAARTAATAALLEFVRLLEERLAALDALPDGAQGDCRLGAERLRELLLASEQVDVPLAELRAIGEEDRRRNAARAAAAAARMGLPLAAAFDRLNEPAPGADDPQGSAARIVGELRALVAASGLVAPPPEGDVCEVRELPAHLPPGFVVFEGPGVFDRPGIPSRLYMPMPRAGQPADVRRLWSARLAPWALRNTIAHEVFPGHHLHWSYLARVPSLAARAFPSSAGIEGWAHYAEELALDLAGRGEVAADPRYELAHVRMALLRDCRFLMTLELHAGGATPEDAAAEIVRWTGFPRVRADLEAHRALVDPGCLAYTLGKLLLLRLREDFARHEGGRFTPRRFHDAVFARGALPIPLLRRALLPARDSAPDGPDGPDGPGGPRLAM